MRLTHAQKNVLKHLRQSPDYMRPLRELLRMKVLTVDENGELVQNDSITSDAMFVLENKLHHYEYVQCFPVEEILPLIGQSERRDFVVRGKTYSVKMLSPRLLTFTKSIRCCCCGLEGKKFALNFASDSPTPHLNLFAEYRGLDVLMTKDHILPASKGGDEELDNLQTMCTLCNMTKGSQNMTVEQLRQHPEVAERIQRMKGLQ